MVGIFIISIIAKSVFSNSEAKNASTENAEIAAAPTATPKASSPLLQEGGSALYSTERADKWRITFEEPIFRLWPFRAPQIKSNSAGTTEIVGYGPRQQGEMYFHSAVAYAKLQRLKQTHRSKQRGTRAAEAAYQELRQFETSKFLLGDIFDNETQDYVSWDWAAHKFKPDELLRRHSRNVVKDWVCYNKATYTKKLSGDGVRPLVECQAFVSVEKCRAPLGRWNDGDKWESIGCPKEDYVPLGRDEHLGGDIALFQSSQTRLHSTDQWNDAKLNRGDIVIFSGVMHCLDIDYVKCHVQATHITVIPSE